MEENWKRLIDYYFEKQKRKEISDKEKKCLKSLINIDTLLERFNIARQYLDKDKIQKEVEEMYPSRTGYENLSWILYHYEAYGNFLYSYQEAWGNFLREFFDINRRPELSQIADDPRLRFVINSEDEELASDVIRSFISNSKIRTIIDDRGESVHRYGEYRFAIQETATQSWKKLISKKDNLIEDASGTINEFNKKISRAILNKLGL